MEDKHTFAKDPRGYTISLSSKRYEEHIINESGHTDVPPGDIIEAIKAPVVIYESSHTPGVDVYFAKSSSVYPSLYVKVPTKIEEETKSGKVVTAFLSPKIGGGIREEKGPKYVGYSNKIR